MSLSTEGNPKDRLGLSDSQARVWGACGGKDWLARIGTRFLFKIMSTRDLERSR